MKITKRVIASFLATLMVMASLLTVNVFAAEEVVFPDVAEDYAYKNAIYSLVNDGIINGISEEGVLKFKPDKTITRAEFATMLAKYLIGDVSLLTAKTDKFADCTNHWANPYIAYAVDADIINGYEDGTFRPDNPVKYGEAIKMLVCAKNYGSLYSSTNPWYSGWIEIAKDMKLTANALLADGSLPANRGLVAQLVYNMDYTKKLNVSNGSAGDKGYNDDDEEEYEELTGVVTAVFKNNLTGENLGLTKFQIMIDDEIFRIEEDSDIQDYYKYLGKMVDIEYIEGSIGEIVRIEESGDNDTFTISAEDIFNVSAEKIEFYDEDDDEDEVKLSDKLYVIYNGQGVPQKDIDDEFIETYFDITCGEITLMNNDGGKDYEIAYVTSYETYYVTGRSVNKDTYTFTDSYSGKSVTLKNDDEDYIVYKASKVGEKTSSTVSGIASSKVVLSVAKPLSSGTVEAIVSTVTLKNASVNSMSGYDRVKIGSEYYSVSDYYMDLIDTDESTYGFEVGDKATFYLDYAGRIVYMTKSESTEPYGYIMAYGEGSGFDSEKAVMLFDASGNIREYPLKSKVRVDGESVENSKVASILEANASVINGDWADDALKNATHSQLVKYATSTENGKTVISELITIDGDLAAGKFSDGKTRIKCDSQSGNVRNFVSQGGFVVNSSTTVFWVPDDRLDEEEYDKKSYSNFHAGSVYLIEAYDIDSTTKAAKAVVVYAGGTSNAATISYNAEVRLIDFIENIANPKDPKNPLQKVYYYTAGSTDRKSIETDEPGLLKGIVAGDLVRFAIENKTVDGKSKDVIVEVQEVFVGGNLYDYEDGTPFETFPAKGNSIAHGTSSDNDYHRVIYATVDSIDVDGNVLNFVPQIVDDNEDYNSNSGWESRSVSSAKFYDFDDDEFLTDLTLGSLTPANNGTTVDAVNASKVVIVMRADSVKAVYVLD